MTQRLLHGIRVVEVADPATEYAGHALAELGAEVFLAEPPGGGPTRWRHPYADVQDQTRRSIPFLARNTDKRSVVLDPRREEDRAAFRRLSAAVDAVIAPQASPFIETNEESAGRDQPAGGPVIVTIVDDCGLGPSSLVPFAASGGLVSSGWSHQPPCNAPSWLALDVVGVYAAGAALLGIRMVRRGQPAPRFAIPLQEAALAGLTPWTRSLISYGMTIAGQGVESGRAGAILYPIYPCLDGYVRVLTSTPRQWEAWVALLGHPDVLAGEEWQDLRFRAQNADRLFQIGCEAISRRRRDDLFHEGQKLGLTITPVLDPQGFMADPHVNARGFLQQVDDPDLGRIRLPRAPYRFGTETVDQEPRPAPSLGAHTAAARALVARSQPGADSTGPNATAPKLPLSGIRVLSLGVGAVIPELSSLMALLGAEVIKIESRRYVDFLRRVGAGGPADHDGSPAFNQMNLGVLSCAVDLSHAAGRDLVRQLASQSDLVMENLRGGVVAQWGLDYESVRRVKSDIVYLSSQGLGDGPYGGYQTYGPNLQAFSGVTALWAHPDDPYPVGTTLNHPDHIAGKQALLPVLAALMRREQSGEGCFIDLAQFEVPAALIANEFLQEQLTPGSAVPLGNRSLDFAPHGCYPCRGEDEWCALAVCDDAQWQHFAAAVGEAWTRDSRFATAEQRLQHVDDLDRQVGGWTRSFAAPQLEALLRAHGVSASRLVTGADLVAWEEAHHRGIFAAVAHPTAGLHWYTGLPLMERESGRVPVRRPPLLGEDTEYVLFDILSLSGEEVSRLMAAGAVGY